MKKPSQYRYDTGPEWSAPEHSAQYLRILRSGLKPEPGAWERSLCNIMLKEIEANQRALRKKRNAIDAKAKRGSAKAIIGRPKSRPKAFGFRAGPRNPWAETEPSDFDKAWERLG